MTCLRAVKIAAALAFGTAFVLYLSAILFINQSSFCMAERRFLAQEEYMASALSKIGSVDIKYHNTERRAFNAGREGFISSTKYVNDNPECCALGKIGRSEDSTISFSDIVLMRKTKIVSIRKEMNSGYVYIKMNNCAE